MFKIICETEEVKIERPTDVLRKNTEIHEAYQKHKKRWGHNALSRSSFKEKAKKLGVEQAIKTTALAKQPKMLKDPIYLDRREYTKKRGDYGYVLSTYRVMRKEKSAEEMLSICRKDTRPNWTGKKVK